MVGRYPTLIKELNAESPQFRRLNDFKSCRQVSFSVAEERRARWVMADRGRNMPPRGHRMAVAGRHQALNAARWHALSVAPRCPVQSLALTHSLSSSRSRVRRGTAMAELPASASPCLWLPHVHPCAPPAPLPSS